MLRRSQLCELAFSTGPQALRHQVRVNFEWRRLLHRRRRRLIGRLNADVHVRLIVVVILPVNNRLLSFLLSLSSHFVHSEHTLGPQRLITVLQQLSTDPASPTIALHAMQSLLVTLCGHSRWEHPTCRFFTLASV